MANRTDNFNRADNASVLGTPSDSGSDWTALNGTWGISSNQAYEPGNTTHAVAVLESSLADVEVQATCSVLVAGGEGGLIARAADNSNYLVLVVAGTALTLFKRVGGGFTNIGSWSGTIASGDVIKMICNGTSVKGYHQGVERISVTESAGSTNTKHGLRVFQRTGWRWDDFSITDLAAGGGGTALMGQICY